MKDISKLMGSWLVNVILVASICLGLYGATKLSYFTATGGTSCPTVLGVPACYIVALAYVFMLLGFLRKKRIWSSYLFLSGLGIAISFALPASLLELFRAGTCPSSSLGLPLCYFSLALCALIAIMWFFTCPKKLIIKRNF